MKKLLALLPAAALLLHGCGSSTSCTSQGANLKTATGGCTSLQSNAQVTIRVSTACQTCADSSPSCSAQFGSGNTEVFLDTQFQVCDSSSGCDTTACNFNPINCTFTVPPGLTTIQYLNGSGQLSSVSVSTGAGGATSCAL